MVGCSFVPGPLCLFPDARQQVLPWDGGEAQRGCAVDGKVKLPIKGGVVDMQVGKEMADGAHGW